MSKCEMAKSTRDPVLVIQWCWILGNLIKGLLFLFTVNQSVTIRLAKMNHDSWTVGDLVADVFSWTYEDLKTYDTSIIEHKIPLKEGAKPFRQKIRKINPMLLPIMEKEVKKLLEAQIIIPLRYSEWVANLVSVRKKSGEIRLCVDFKNLNRSSKKDNYPLPKMEYIL